jgi:LacI family transcriptional regulator
VKKRVSLKDIAKKVGVSTALVSYALNKEKESRVGKEMAAKIRQAAKELNYQPNQIAKSLRSGKSYTIGLIVADISNPFFANIARTIEDEAKRNNYTVIFGSSDENAERAWDLINVFLNRQVDGFIIVPSENSEKQIFYLKKNNIPFVLLDRYFPEIPTSYVAIDNFKAAYEAVSRLIESGHERIGMVAYQTKLFHMQERRRGYWEALWDHNLISESGWLKEVRHGRVKEDIEVVMNEMLSMNSPIDAVLFASNTLAINGLKYINRLQLKVPDDLAVINFDEGDLFEFFYCPLTHVRQPIAELGEKSVKVLLKMINKKEDVLNQVCLDADLVLRESCGGKAKIMGPEFQP